MHTSLRSILNMIDWTVHPELRRRGGMSLLRARMLSLASLFTMPTCIGFLLAILMSQAFSFRFVTLIALIALSLALLIANRLTRHVTILAGAGLIMMSLLVGLNVIIQARSLIAPGLLWCPVLMMPNFLLCGRRVGLIVCLVMMTVGVVTIQICRGYGYVLPFGNDPVIGMRTLMLTIVLTNGLTLGVVTVYIYLMLDHEKNSRERRTWVQRTARMQELLQMSGHFALQTNRPLDVLGTALHNLEDPLQHSLQPRSLLPLLEPVETSIRDLAAVSKSFSLFSRRYLEEGLEQTSVNVILQHVDTIYNVGSALRHARLHWEKLDEDVPIYTQTAKLVMLMISLIRSAASAGGTAITAVTQKEADGLTMSLRYKLPPPLSKGPRRLEVAADDREVVFDPELTEDLIHELCVELGIQRSLGREGDQNLCRLKLPA